MNRPKILENKSVMNAIYLGTLCSIAYLAVYFARNVLSVVTPQMIEGGYSESYIGRVSSVYFVFYAIGQLINGIIGDKIKARYMISFGLLLSAITNVVFAYISYSHPVVALIAYGLTGFFMAMIYGPMTKVVAENTEQIYAVRCTLGFTFASFIGSPLAGIIASFVVWQSVFLLSSISLFVMAVMCFIAFLVLEKKKIIKYNQFKLKEGEKGGIKTLIKRQIIKFTWISMITGVIRTTVVFWLPTYISQYLSFSSEQSAGIFTIATFVISLTTFIAVFIYERLRRDMDLSLISMFTVSAICFALLYVVKQPVINIILIVLAIMASNGAATILWSIYCPSLYDTGMVSGATGYLDFVSYIAAAISSTLFADAVSVIGWGNLILIWMGLMIIGVLVSLPVKKKLN